MLVESLRRRAVVASLCAASILAVLSASAAPALGQATPEATPSVSSLSVAPGPGDGEITVRHIQGETVVPLNPEVVVSYDIATVDTLTTLGVEVDGMPELPGGDDRYRTDATLAVGTLFEPDYEALAAAEPDLIIVASRSGPALPELSKIAPTIDLSFPGEGFAEDFRSHATVLAAIFGKEAELAPILDGLDARIAALQAQAAESGTALVVMTTGGSVTALAPGNEAGNRGALIYEVLGFQPPLEDIEGATHGEPISFEFLLEHDPSWLFVIDRDAATGEEGGQPAEAVLDNDLVRETSASQSGQIVYLNPFDWYVITGAGLGSMDRMLSELEVVFTA